MQPLFIAFQHWPVCSMSFSTWLANFSMQPDSNFQFFIALVSVEIDGKEVVRVLLCYGALEIVSVIIIIIINYFQLIILTLELREYNS